MKEWKREWKLVFRVHYTCLASHVQAFPRGSLKRAIGAVERFGFRASGFGLGLGFRVSGLFRGSGVGFLWFTASDLPGLAC